MPLNLDDLLPKQNKAEGSEEDGRQLLDGEEGVK
jgi:hypothetical protein